jgi:glycosyltransferase involved in cell wall biosynthesis
VTSIGRLQISVIIPHFNQLAALDMCLASLEGQSLPRDRFEILVVDNGSSGGIEPIEAMVGARARLLVERTKGAGPARNRGAREAAGEVFAFIDADCSASPHWLEEGLTGLKQFDIVGGRVDVSVRDETDMSGPEAFERVFAFDFRHYIETMGFTGSGNMFCGREVFEKVGGFRPAVSEDKDWSHRATGMGFTLGYQDAAAITHPARIDWTELTAKWRRLNREAMHLSEDRRGGRGRFLARSWLLPASILPHAARILTTPKLPDRRSRMRAIGTLAAIRLWRMADAHRAFFGR